MTLDTNERPLLVIPDTNVFVHFIAFDHVPWNQIVEEHDVTLVVLAAVVSELDKLKSDPRVRDRVRAVLPRIEAAFADADEATLQSGIRARFVGHSDARRIMARHHLVAQSGDDRILAAVLRLSRTDRVSIITDDTGMRLRARALQLPVRRMPDEPYRIKSTDPAAAELAKVRRELEELTRAMPKLQLTFEEGGGVLRLERSATIPKKRGGTFAEIVAGELSPLSLERLPMIYQFELEKPTQRELDRYNAKLEELRPAHEEFLRARDAFRLFPHRSIRIQLTLTNEGGKPAEKTRVRLRLPRGVIAIAAEEAPHEPQPPKRPPLPGRHRLMSYADELQSLKTTAQLIDEMMPQLNVEPIRLKQNISGPEIEDDEIVYDVRELSNFDALSLPAFFLCFETPADVKSFQLDYSMRTHSFPKPIPGSLHVVVDRPSDDVASDHSE